MTDLENAPAARRHGRRRGGDPRLRGQGVHPAADDGLSHRRTDAGRGGAVGRAGGGRRPDDPAVGHVRPQRPAQPGRAATTAKLVSVQVNSDGTATFDLPRAEVGQGITTATAMIIADEMDIPIDRVKIRLADARPELLFNQLTGGSNSMHSIFGPVRTAAATARGRLVQAAAAQFGVSALDLIARATASSRPATGARRRTARSRRWPR